MRSQEHVAPFVRFYFLYKLGCTKLLNIARIEALIKEKGWSNSYFCSLSGKNRGWIRDWKRGLGLPDENTLHDIADRLDTTVEYLTDQTDEKGQKNKPLTEREKLNQESINIMNSLPDDLYKVAHEQLKSLAALANKNRIK